MFIFIVMPEMCVLPVSFTFNPYLRTYSLTCIILIGRYSAHHVGRSGQSIGMAGMGCSTQLHHSYPHVHVFPHQNHMAQDCHPIGQIFDDSPDCTIRYRYYGNHWSCIHGRIMRYGVIAMCTPLSSSIRYRAHFIVYSICSQKIQEGVIHPSL